MNGNKRSIASYLENFSLAIVGILFVMFPLLFLSTTTDAFVLPKQLLLIGLTSLALVVFALKTIFEGRMRIRTSPFDIPVFLFLVVSILSAVFSANRFDAMIAVTPLLFVVLLYFVIVNAARGEKQLLFLLSALTIGAVLSALLTVCSFFNINLLPFAYTKTQAFTTFGSLLDQALYFALVLPIAGYFGYGFLNSQKNNPAAAEVAAAETTSRKKSRSTLGAFGIAFIVIAIGLGLSVYMLLTSQKPLILPFDTGLQTAFAAISQNSSNVFKSLLLGSGFGTFLNDFTQFKPVTYNANQTLWAFTFFRSSSFALELLATTGLAGLAVFGFLIYRIVRQKNFFLPLVLAVIASLVLPFSFTLLALFFILLALFAIVVIHSNPNKYTESAWGFLSFRRKRSTEVTHEVAPRGRFAKVAPIVGTVLLVVVLAGPLYLITRFALSDVIFQQSLVAASQNKGIETYQLQASSINMFPYRDIYYRSFSQTNLALANALATNQPKGSSPSADTQKNILTLIQQSINAGRTAVTVSPLTSFNWNNLSSIYRSLIGFGQNADRFTVLTLNQAVALDPNNPQQYVDLGGVYYQLGQYDEAIRQFQVAINLKQDYANAYYNLGHALEEKGDFAQALTAYQTVKQLVSDNADNTKKINEDIAALAKREQGQAQQQQQQAAAPTPAPTGTEAIDVNKAGTQLPERNPKEKIPAPTIANPLPSPATAGDQTNN